MTRQTKNTSKVVRMNAAAPALAATGAPTPPSAPDVDDVTATVAPVPTLAPNAAPLRGKKPVIHWKVEWQFDSASPPVTITCDAIPAKNNVCAVVADLLSPAPVRGCPPVLVATPFDIDVPGVCASCPQCKAAQRHKLRAYCPVAVSDLVYMLHHPFCAAGKPVFTQLVVRESTDLATALAGCVILEYPTISVVLPDFDRAAYPLLSDVAVPAGPCVDDGPNEEDEESSESDDDSDSVDDVDDDDSDDDDSDDDSDDDDDDDDSSSDDAEASGSKQEQIPVSVV